MQLPAESGCDDINLGIDYKTLHYKAKTQKTLLWVIFAISALLLVLVMLFPGEKGNNISVLRMAMMIAFGLWGVIYVSYKLKKQKEE